MSKMLRELSVAAAMVLPLVSASAAPVKNGFDLQGAAIPVTEILQGGPPRDGIPAIDQPRFLSADEAADYDDSARVLGVRLDGIAKAYPIAILNWHEIVNDRFAGRQVVVSFCPLCGTGMAFGGDPGGAPSEFGVSGLLYNSDVLLYDRETGSLWSQILRRAVSGPMQGTELEMVATANTSWGDWRARYPESLLLSEDTGYRRDYSRSPYGSYETNSSVYFPVSASSARYHPKEQVIGLQLDGVTRAYPFSELDRLEGPISDQVSGQSLTIEFDGENRSGRVLNDDGEEIPTVISYWFAWYAFYPDGEVFTAARE